MHTAELPPASKFFAGVSRLVASSSDFRTAGARGAWALLLAFGVLCAGPAEVQAQTEITLVQNLNQAGGPFNVRPFAAQSFTTGGNDAGYGLASVTLSVGGANTENRPNGFLVRIFPDRAGAIPDERAAAADQVVTLTSPDSIQDVSLNTFTAPANTTLSARTTYHIVISGADGQDLPSHSLPRTASSQEDSDMAAGWSLGSLKQKVPPWSSLNSSSYVRITGTIASSATGAPSISGTARVGETLTVDTSGIMDANGLVGVVYSYLWIRVDGGDETPITGVTGNTYALTGADTGKALKVRVSFTDNGGFAETLTSAVTMVVQDLLLAGNTGQEASGPLGGLAVGNVRPQNLARHTQGFQTGSHDDGYDVNSVGVWLGVVEASAGESMTLYLYTQGPNGSLGEQLYTLSAPASFVEGAVNLFGAPSGAALHPDTDYLLALTATGDFGGDFRVQVTASDAEDGGGEPGWLIENAWRLNGQQVPWGDAWMIRVGGSPRSSPVPNHPATGRVEVTGRAQAGQTLTASVEDVADPVDGLGSPSYTYQWFRVSGGGAIGTGPTYPLESADIGSQVRAEASFTDDRSNAEMLSSGAYPPGGRVRGRSNADLGSLSVDGVEELYVTNDGSFYVSLSGITSATESVTLRFALAQADASCQVKYSQDDLQSNAALSLATELLGSAACTGTGEQVVDVALAAGDNYVAVIARAEAGNKKRFIVILHREEEPDYTLEEEGQTHQGVRYSFPEASPGVPIRIVLSGDAEVEDDYVLYRLDEDSTVTRLTGPNYTAPVRSDGHVDLRVEAVDDTEMEEDEVFMVTVRWDGPAQPLQGSGVGGRSASTEYVIEDNDAAVEVSFGTGPYEAIEGGTPAGVLVNLSAPSPRLLAIPLTVVRGAESGGRGGYSVSPNPVPFPLGQMSAMVTVTDVDDDVDDDMESVVLRFGSLPTNVTAVAPITATVTLTDDDDPEVTVSYDMSSYEVLEDGETSVEVTVELSADPEREVEIQITATDQDGAMSGQDYSGVPTSVTFMAGGSLMQSFTVTAMDDDIDDDGESVLLGFGTLSDEKVSAGSTATVTIEDDDDPEVEVSYDMSGYEAREDGTIMAEVTVELSADPEREVEIQITATGQGGAMSGQDYSEVPGSVTFMAGGSLMQSFTVTAMDDDIDDDGESVLLGFGTLPPGVMAVSPDEAVVTLSDDDNRGLTLSTTRLDIAEADVPETETYTVVLGSQPTAAVTVSLTVEGADTLTTLPTMTPSVLEFTTSNWAVARTVTVTVAADEDAEDESATVTHEVSGGDYGVSENETLAVEVDDDETMSTQVVLMTNRTTVSETEGPVEITLTATLNEGAFKEQQVLMVPVRTGVLTEPEDYTGPAEVELTILAQMLSGTATFTLTATNDDLWEPAVEGIRLGRGASGSPPLNMLQLIIGITSEDAEPVLSFTANKTEIPETGGSVEMVVEIINGAGYESDRHVSLDFSESTATRGVDFTDDVPAGIGSQLTLAAGVVTASATVTVTAVHDTVDEDDGDPGGGDDEIIDVAISSQVGFTSPPNGIVQVAILDDDDPEVTVSYDMSRYEVSEAGETSAVVMVSVSANPEREIVVGLTQVPGVGVTGTDYTTDLSSSVTFSASDHAPHNFTVSADEDDLDEDEETVMLGFASLPPEVLGDSTATVAIEDNDTRGVDVSPSSVTVREGNDGDYEVMLLSEPTGAVTVTVASDNVDVTVSPSSLEFTTSNWAVVQTVTVSVGMDADAEAETAMLAHAASGADYAGETAVVSVMVNDDDAPSTGVVLSVAPMDVGEGAGATEVAVTAELDGAAFLTATTVSVAVAAGTAVAGDYGASPNSFEIVILANDDSANGTFTLTPVDDAVDEDNETVSVTGTAAGLMMSSATVTIEDDDTRGVSVSVTLVELEEDAGASSSGAYTVVLESAPTDAVTVTVSSGDAALVTVSPSSLTFTPVNWETARTVTVRAESDVNASDGSTQVTHVVSGADYGANGVTAAPVTVSVTDNNTTSSEVTLSVAPGVAGEGGGGQSVVVTAQLNASPFAQATTVSVSVSAGTAVAGDYTASPTSLMIVIQPDASSASGTFTLTPVDDDVDENDETVSVTGMASGLMVLPTMVAIVDDDTRGVSVSPTALPVDEGRSGEYTVVLLSAPTGAVTVAVSSDNADVTVQPSSLEFTPGDWGSPQTVEVSAGADTDAAVDMARLTHAASGADYGGETALVEVTVADGDTASGGVELLVAPSMVDEGSGQTAVTVTARLDGAALVTDLTVSVSVEAGTALAEDYAAVPTSLALLIPVGEFSAVETFRLTPVDDAVDEDDETVSVTGTVPNSLTVSATTVTIEDDDTRGVSVSPTQLSLTEGERGNYAVVLESAPTGVVTVRVAVGAGVSVFPAQLVFTASDWSDAQTVTVVSGSDADANDESETVSHAVSGADYGANGVTAVAVDVVVTDNNDPSSEVRLSVSPSEVSESSGAVAVTVTGRLDKAPQATATEVMLTVEGATASAADYTASSGVVLTIEAFRLEGTAVVTVTPVADEVDEDDETLTVSGTTPGLSVVAATVTLEDDDTRGVAVLANNAVVTVLEGGTETYTVALLSAPVGTVTVAVTVTGDTDVTVQPSSLVFTAADWSVARTVTVRAATDADAATDVARLAHAVSGADYGANGVMATPVDVTVTDSDTRGVVVSASSVTVPEGGMGAYTVALSSSPVGTVTVAVLSDLADVTVLPASLVFTAGTWAMAQTVTVSAAQDEDANVDVATVSHAVSGADYGQNGVTAAPVTVTVDDDEKPSTEIRLSMTPSAVSEGAAPVEFLVTGQLDGAAQASDTEVTLTVAPGPSHAAVTATLRIPTGLMSGTVVLLLTPVDNAVDGEDVVVAVTAATGSGLQLVGVLAVTIEDDDERGVTVLPTELEVREGESGSYEVTLLSEPTGAVTVSVLSGDADVMAEPLSLVFTAGDWEVAQTVTVSAMDDSDVEDDAQVEVAHEVNGADYGANGVAAEPVEVLVPGFEVDIDGVLQVQVPEDGVVTVPEGTSVPENLEVRLPQTENLSAAVVSVQEEVVAEVDELPRGFRVDDVVVDIELKDEDGEILSLGEGESAVVCLPSESGRRVSRYDDEATPPAWVALAEPVGGSPAGLACGVTEHFSLFALGVPLEEPVLAFKGMI